MWGPGPHARCVRRQRRQRHGSGSAAHHRAACKQMHMVEAPAPDFKVQGEGAAHLHACQRHEPARAGMRHARQEPAGMHACTWVRENVRYARGFGQAPDGRGGGSCGQPRLALTNWVSVESLRCSRDTNSSPAASLASSLLAVDTNAKTWGVHGSMAAPPICLGRAALQSKSRGSMARQLSGERHAAAFLLTTHVLGKWEASRVTVMRALHRRHFLPHRADAYTPKRACMAGAIFCLHIASYVPSQFH